MLDAVNPNACYCRAGKAVKQHAAKRVAQRVPEAALERLHGEPAVDVVVGNLQTLDVRFFDFCDHGVLPSYYWKPSLKTALCYATFF